MRFFRAFVRFFLLYETPNFVAFNVLHRHVHDQPAHELFATLTAASVKSFMIVF